MRYWEVSAKENKNIHELISAVTKDTYEKLHCTHETHEVDPGEIPEFYKQRASELHKRKNSIKLDQFKFKED